MTIWQRLNLDKSHDSVCDQSSDARIIRDGLAGYDMGEPDGAIPLRQAGNIDGERGGAYKVDC